MRGERRPSLETVDEMKQFPSTKFDPTICRTSGFVYLRNVYEKEKFSKEKNMHIVNEITRQGKAKEEVRKLAGDMIENYVGRASDVKIFENSVINASRLHRPEIYADE